jgi:hypothetical protein
LPTDVISAHGKSMGCSGNANRILAESVPRAVLHGHPNRSPDPQKRPSRKCTQNTITDKNFVGFPFSFLRRQRIHTIRSVTVPVVCMTPVRAGEIKKTMSELSRQTRGSASWRTSIPYGQNNYRTLGASDVRRVAASPLPFFMKNRPIVFERAAAANARLSNRARQ